MAMSFICEKNIKALAIALAVSAAISTWPVFALSPWKETGSTEAAAQPIFQLCTWSITIRSLEDSGVGQLECDNDRVLAGVQCEDQRCSGIALFCCSMKARYYGDSGVYSADDDFCNKGLASAIKIQSTEDFVQSSSSAGQFEPMVRYLQRRNENMFVTGVGCSGIGCSTVYLLARPFQCQSKSYLIAPKLEDGRSACIVTPWSGPERIILCPSKYITTGLQCTGKDCRLLRLECCPIHSACSMGQYGDNQECHKCPPGRFGSSPGLSSPGCSGPCPSGTFSPTAGLTSPEKCTRCPAGTYSSDEGAISAMVCKPCPPGTFGQHNGADSSSCTGSCPLGTFSKRWGLRSAEDCTPCPPGTFSDVGGSVACKKCPRNTFSIQNGLRSMDECQICDPGRFTGACADTVLSKPESYPIIS